MSLISIFRNNFSFYSPRSTMFSFGRQASRVGRTACAVSSRPGGARGAAAMESLTAPRCLSTRTAGGVLLDAFPGMPPNEFVDCTSVAATEITKMSNGVTVASEDIAGPWCAVSGEPSSPSLFSRVSEATPSSQCRDRVLLSLHHSHSPLPPTGLDLPLHPEPKRLRTCRSQLTAQVL